MASFFSNTCTTRSRSGSLLCAVAIDAEEDFNWKTPVYGTPHSTRSMRNLRDVQPIFAAYGIKPIYLVTYPVLEDKGVVQMLQRYVERGECEVGMQLHPWVTPPFAEDRGAQAAHSYSGNLDPELEVRKLVELMRKFAASFGSDPKVYRAGRYGLSPRTAIRLEELGFQIDTSLAPRTDFSLEDGPNYSDFDYSPFWFGRRRQLLELPLCRSIVGWGAAMAHPLHRFLIHSGTERVLTTALLTRTRFAERITLSPEGNDTAAMQRLVRGLRNVGNDVLVLSFHSSSLAIGGNPYVTNKAELHYFYDRLSGILDYIAQQQPMQFVRFSEIGAQLEPPHHKALSQ